MRNHNLKLRTDTRTRTYRCALKIINFIDRLPREMSTQIISRQLLRCATSIGANVVEAHNETKFWLGLLKDANKADVLIINPLSDEVNEIANILASSLLTLKGRKKF